MLLQQMVVLAPAEVEVERFDLVSLPFYNGDLEGDLPEPVRIWKEKIRQADGILIATPQYNYSIPALTKNAIDWGTRPPTDNVWKGKPVGIMGAPMVVSGPCAANSTCATCCSQSTRM